MINMYVLKKKCIYIYTVYIYSIYIYWVWPLPSNSDDQGITVFVGNPYKPLFVNEYLDLPKGAE